MQYLVSEEDLDDVAEIFRTCARLEERSGLPFGPDGYTLGSAGELIAAYVFDLVLLPSAAAAGYDAETTGHHGLAAGKKVQIKTTSKGPGKGLRWRDAMPAPDFLLVVRVCPPEAIEILYNGPYAFVWSNYLHNRPLASANNTRSVRINRLIELNDEVHVEQRVPCVRGVPEFRPS